MTADGLKGRAILLCVSGSIAAYKACEVARLLVKAGARVRVAMTRSAVRFVSPLTFQALTGAAVSSDLFHSQQELTAGHIAQADAADLIVVAPATAHLLGAARLGLADDVVLAALLAARGPVLFAPAMNERMWAHAAVQENVRVLRERGARFVGPNAGEMAEAGHVGMGRLAEPEEILAAVRAALGPRDLTGKKVVITAGPTREHLDPVRFLSNPSSGKMGFAIAEAACDRGAEVVLISGPVALTDPPHARVVRVVTAEEMLAVTRREAAGAHVLVMAAAVADQRAEKRATHKVSKKPGAETVSLVRTEDILLTLAAEWERTPSRPIVVGFAAETERVIERAKEKLSRKRMDLIVANDVSRNDAGFGTEENAATILDQGGGAEEISRVKKRVLADRVLDRVVLLIAKRA